MSKPIVKHIITEWSEFSPKAYVSNGFVGFRFGKNPFDEVDALLSGFFGLKGARGVETLAPTLAPEFHFYDGENELKTETVKQSYDFSNGEFETEALLNIGEKKISVCYMSFCSRTSPTLLASKIEFTSDEEAEIRCTLALTVPAALSEYLKVKSYATNSHEFVRFGCEGDIDNISSKMGVAYVISAPELRTNGDGKTEFTVKADKNGTAVTVMYSYVPGVMHSEPENQAWRMVKLAKWNGFDRIREQNRKAWAKIWESRIEIEGGNPEWQNVIDASMFYLVTSVSEFAPLSVAPYGLSTNIYEGHSFWDTESFMFMTPMLCFPDMAESMLDYRFRRIPAAENNARLNGYKGIQFPWQSGISGDEVTVPFAGQAGGAGEQHINLDVALAFDGYARVSGDEVFIRDKAWRVISGVAEWIESRVEKTERGYEILHVTGIDEESDDVSNDSYTNLMSQRLLRSAADYSVKLGYGERKKWREIADGMVVPKRDGVLLQYEGMHEREKLASVTMMSYFPYGYTDTKENDRRTFEFYVSHGMEEYLRYPMLSGFLGIFPTWAGDRKKGLDFYEKSNLTFFCDPFYSCTEWAVTDTEFRSKPKFRVNCNFITARGSLLSGLLMGLTKLCPWRADPDGDIDDMLGENIILPDGWERITLNKIYLRGKAYRAVAKHGAEKTVLEEI